MSKFLKVFLFAFLAFPFTANAVTFVSWGGAYTESQIKAYGDTYSDPGSIQFENYNGGLGEIRAQVESGNVTWDIVDVLPDQAITGCDEGLFEDISGLYDTFTPAPNGDSMIEDMAASGVTNLSDCCAPQIFWTYVVFYDPDAFPGDKPSEINDFFDTDKFPGKRAIYKNAMSNLEIALVADGVKASGAQAGGDLLYRKLEGAGIDRAIAKIKKLCTDPNGGCVFWNAGAQPPELLANGEVVMATGWNGRFFNAEIGEGAPLKQVWDAQGLDYQYMSIVKGGPNQADAMKAVAEMTSTHGLAGSAKYIAYAPWRKSSLKVIEAGEPWYKDGKTNMMEQMPTHPNNTKNYFLVDPIFWADNSTEIGERWEAMKAGL